MTELELFARLIQCEAGGEGDNGMRAVASVVMNRVRTREGEYGRYNTLREVIFQTGQFNCARTELGGQQNLQNIYNMNPQQIHYDIANWAIAGNRLANLWGGTVVLQPLLPYLPQQLSIQRGLFPDPHREPLLL